jgi:hypothetical protein
MAEHIPPIEVEILDYMKRSWQSERHFFSNRGKEERERWVAKEFLSHMSIPLSVEEIRSEIQASKVDVAFRDARFQIKEIMEPDVRRGDEIKAISERVKSATKLAETIGPTFVYDVPPPVKGYDLILEKLKELDNDRKYKDIQDSLDLLFYVTRTRTSPVQEQDIDARELASFGWRSISCLMGNYAFVLFARDEAPTFIASNLLGK